MFFDQKNQKKSEKAASDIILKNSQNFTCQLPDKLPI